MYMHLLLPLSNQVIGARLPKEGAVHDLHIRRIDNSGRLVGNPSLTGLRKGCPFSHDQRSRRGGDAGREDHALCRHSCLSENLGVHHDDVSHRDEGGEATKHLLFNGGVILSEFKVAIDQSSPMSPLSSDIQPQPSLPVAKGPPSPSEV